ncbi:glycosyltransferase [Sphingomonas morindae]|uniref:Rhamnosyl transferase n=1 Tax=Sphingomonas morindae TaxID=1541170 RepID=A0ABY4X7M0_9SPHN|nr:glycosyltransferase [Sphingomonas morindae]USI72909.1 putative rhamnosyl transferase [Sphingomonas morindae]
MSAAPEPFFFGIPLIARAAARDWARVDWLLARTLDSLRAQTDRDFTVLLAAHEAPPCWARVAGDPRFELLEADWPSAAPSAANDDGGCKKWRIKEAVTARGGGLLMFLDADDWLASGLVAEARRAIGPDQVGAVLGAGLALDLPSLRVASFPLGPAYDGPFHGLCGSSTIARVVAGDAEPIGRDPHAVLGSHHEWPARAAALGVALATLRTPGLYMMGTGQNHSETDGPFTAWRRAVTAWVRAEGRPLAAAEAAAFGQDWAALQAVAGGERAPGVARAIRDGAPRAAAEIPG